MTTRKTILVLLALCCLAAFFSVEGRAAEWVTCTIDQVGPSGLNEGTHGSFIYLTDTANPPAWPGSKKMIISPDRGKEFLATALTALASGKAVKVRINPLLDTPTITAIFVQNN